MAPLNNFTNNQFDRPLYPESIFSKFLPKKRVFNIFFMNLQVEIDKFINHFLCIDKL